MCKQPEFDPYQSLDAYLSSNYALDADRPIGLCPCSTTVLAPVIMLLTTATDRPYRPRDHVIRSVLYPWSWR